MRHPQQIYASLMGTLFERCSHAKGLSCPICPLLRRPTAIGQWEQRGFCKPAHQKATSALLMLPPLAPHKSFPYYGCTVQYCSEMLFSLLSKNSISSTNVAQCKGCFKMQLQNAEAVAVCSFSLLLSHQYKKMYRDGSVISVSKEYK